MSGPMTGDGEFRNEIVRIAELTVTDTQIQGYTFVNCQIVGPAVLIPLEAVSLSHCTWEGDVNALFWEIDMAKRPMVIGGVGVQECNFFRCSFKAVGFAGSSELRQMMEESLSE